MRELLCRLKMPGAIAGVMVVVWVVGDERWVGVCRYLPPIYVAPHMSEVQTMPVGTAERELEKDRLAALSEDNVNGG